MEQLKACGDLLSGLDALPRGRQFDQDALLVDTGILVHLDEALSPLHHSRLVKGESDTHM